MFSKPKYLLLADPKSEAKVLGQGTLYIIINDTHRIWIFAFLTDNTDALLSAVDHFSYRDCTISGAYGQIKIAFPTFHFNVSASKRFECKISPGKSSN